MKKKKEIKRMILAGVSGFVIAMILMAVVIFFGYTKAYASGVPSMDVTLFSLPIYQLTSVDGRYAGSALSQNMGIISFSFAALGMAAERLVSAGKRKPASPEPAGSTDR